MRFVPLFYPKPAPWWYNIPGIMGLIVAALVVAIFIKALAG